MSETDTTSLAEATVDVADGFRRVVEYRYVINSTENEEAAATELADAPWNELPEYEDWSLDRVRQENIDSITREDDEVKEGDITVDTVVTGNTCRIRAVWPDLKDASLYMAEYRVRQVEAEETDGDDGDSE